MISKFSVILTFFNEAENLYPLFKELEQVLPLQTEVVLVDDASTDQSWKITSELKSENLTIKRIRNSVRSGLAASVLTGIRGATGDYVLLMDSDFTHNPKDINKLIECASSFDLVVASRYITGGGMQPWYLKITSHAYVKLLRTYLQTKTRDLLGGFLLFRRLAFEPIFKKHFFEGFGDFSIAICLFAEVNNLKVTEIPVVFQQRKAGEKKSRRLGMAFSYLKSSRKFKTALKSRN